MKSGKNIFNAFDVIWSTYESLELMLDECRKLLVATGKYKCLTPDFFIRYKSDAEIVGWFTRQIFLVFQNIEKSKQNDLLILEVNLYDIYGYYDEPMLELSKFSYYDSSKILSEMNRGTSYYFSHPLYDDLAECVEMQNNQGYYEIIFSEELSNKRFYMGVQRIVCTDIPLVNVNSKNLSEIVLNGFIELEKL